MKLTLNKQYIARSFSKAAKTYDNPAFIQKEIGARLLKRTALIQRPLTTILDIGAGTGFLTRQLQNQFPDRYVIGIDLAFGMMHFARSQHKSLWFYFKKKPTYICGDTTSLPFKTASFDLIFSNFTLQWCSDSQIVFKEFKRILKPHGILFFSTLGPDTLQELRKSFQTVDHYSHVNEFKDMHDYGDLLLQARFIDPVMDMEKVTAIYQDIPTLLNDLKATGAHNIHADRPRGCMTQQQLRRLFKAYEAFQLPNGTYPATFEVIYGHACGGDQEEALEKHLKIPSKIAIV